MTTPVRLFGLDFAACDLAGAVAEIIAFAKARHRGLIVTPNVDQIVAMRRDPAFRRIAEAALLRVADGMPVVWTSRLAGASLPARVTGADLLPALAAEAARCDLSLYLLGAGPGVADSAAQCLRERHPGLRIVGTYSPPLGFEMDAAECERIVAAINEVRPDLLFVGFGAPKQEKWADRWQAQLDVGPILCVGAAFDFVAGKVRRAPPAVQRAGLEWAWRLAAEPRRLWRRYIVEDAAFLPLAIGEIRRQRRARGGR